MIDILNSTNFKIGVVFGVIVAWFFQGVGILFEYLCKKFIDKKKKEVLKWFGISY